MSFNCFKELIEEGDVAILYVSFNIQTPIEIKKKTTNKNGDEIEYVHQTTYGAVKVKDLIGRKYGSKVKLSRGYCYILHPTPELWTRTLPHRTQILYATDIAMIVQQLGLKPGSKVIECGTGSGSLSHSLVRTIIPHGHLFTFDFHQERLDTAMAEFKRHKIDSFVTATRADACADGFGSEMENAVDAVFLDLPHPWDAVGHAKKCIRRSTGGRICSFSPCIEQVQKAIEVMTKEGFEDINTMECLIRTFQVRRITLPEFDPEKLPVAASSNGNEEQPEESKKRKIDQAEEGESCDKNDPSTFVTAVPNFTDMAGHTGFLTFATLPAIFEEEVNGKS